VVKNSSNFDLSISTLSGAGLAELVSLLIARGTALLEGDGHDENSAHNAPILTRARHREALHDAHAHLLRAMQAELPELTAEDVRLAIRALGRITGHVDVEDILDIIFRDFCIGK
jgi:tRNA modification GTPase